MNIVDICTVCAFSSLTANGIECIELRTRKFGDICERSSLKLVQYLSNVDRHLARL